jgi:hypothetical protein
MKKSEKVRTKTKSGEAMKKRTPSSLLEKILFPT